MKLPWNEYAEYAPVMYKGSFVAAEQVWQLLQGCVTSRTGPPSTMDKL